MKRVLTLLLFAIALTVPGCSSEDENPYFSTGRIEGGVTDKTSGNPISDATITLNPGGHQTLSVSNGNFSLNRVPIGKYDAVCNATGYQAQKLEVVVEKGAIARLYFQLMKDSSQTPEDGNGNEGNDDGGSDDSGNDDSGQGGAEDYSSATVTTCDSRVEVEIVSCKRTGSTVVFTYRLTNMGLGVVNDWRIYPTNSMSLISGGFRSTVFDDLGNEYFYSLFTFRDKSSKDLPVAAALPEDTPCKGTVTVYEVPGNASKLTVMLGVFAYPDQSYYLADKRIYFKNVPIY